MKVIRDPENWERTGLYRLAIRDRDCRHPVWTQAGSDAQSVGSAGPGLPPLAASAGEKKKPPPDWTVRRFRSQDGVSLIGLSARVSVSLSDVARPPLCRASLQGVTPHSGYPLTFGADFFHLNDQKDVSAIRNPRQGTRLRRSSALTRNPNHRPSVFCSFRRKKSMVRGSGRHVPHTGRCLL